MDQNQLLHDKDLPIDQKFSTSTYKSEDEELDDENHDHIYDLPIIGNVTKKV